MALEIPVIEDDEDDVWSLHRHHLRCRHINSERRVGSVRVAYGLSREDDLTQYRWRVIDLLPRGRNRAARVSFNVRSHQYKSQGSKHYIAALYVSVGRVRTHIYVSKRIEIPVVKVDWREMYRRNTGREWSDTNR